MLKARYCARPDCTAFQPVITYLKILDISPGLLEARKQFFARLILEGGLIFGRANIQGVS